MTIEKYIADLLYRHQCVIIPSFGAFISETVSAQLLTDSHTILPPRKQIAFNSMLKNNDGVLAHHIAKMEEITFDDAIEKIKNTNIHWQQLLQNQHILYFPNIGHITKNSEGKLQFTAIEGANFLTTSFGLSPVEAHLTQTEDINTSPAIGVNHLPTRKTKNNHWWKYAAASVAGMALLGTVYNYQNNYQQYLSQSLAVEKQVQNKVQEELQQATFYIQAPEMVASAKKIIDTQTAENSGKNYHIVAGAFRTDAKAQVLVDELKQRGFSQAHYLPKQGVGMRNVVYQSFTTIEAAQKQLSEIQKNTNPDAWIFIEKK